MTDKNTARKNKQLAAGLVVMALLSALAAVVWFNMYAPAVLFR